MGDSNECVAFEVQMDRVISEDKAVFTPIFLGVCFHTWEEDGEDKQNKLWNSFLLVYRRTGFL